MATIKSEYYFFNGSEWDLHYFRTSADMVVGLDSALSNYVGLTGDETISGDKAFTGMVNANVFTYDGGVRKILNPKGGTYSNTASDIDGAIRIKLPATANFNSMMRMIVDVYDFNFGASFTVEISGYLSGSWYNKTAIFSSTTNMDITPKISFGYDENNYGVIYIGDYAASAQWGYAVISVREVLIGHSGDDNVEWNDGFQISYATDLGGDVIDEVEDGKGMDAETLGGHLASYFKVEGSAPVSHTHDYLPLVGGTLSGDLQLDKDGADEVGSHGIKFQANTASADYIKELRMTKEGTLMFGADEISESGHTHDIPLATSNTVGGIKARVDGSTLYITTDGTDA